MRGIAVGVQEADGDRLDALRAQAQRGGAHFGGIQRGQNVAVAVQPFGHFQAVAAGHQRFGELQEQVVDVVALLGAHLQDVAEAARGDQAEPGAGALDQRVGDQRGAVHRVADVGEGQAGGGQQFGQTLQVRRPMDRAAWSGICAGGSRGAAVSSRMKSVNVPPMSKPMR